MTRLALAVLVCAAGTGWADDTAYTVKLKKPSAADRLKVTKDDTQTVVVALTVNGTNRDSGQTNVRKYTYTDEVLARASDGQPTRVRRVYEAAEFSTNGRKNEAAEPDRPILATKAGEKFAFAFEKDGGAVPKAVAADLDRDFNRNTDEASREVLTPTKPVKVNDTWQVDAAKVAKGIGSDEMALDPAKSSATGKLTKVYTKDGKQWGVLEYKIELAVTKIKSGPNELPLKPGSKMTMALTVDTCIDGTDAGYDSKAVMAAELEADQPGLAMTMKLDSKGGGTGEEVGKK